MNTNKPTPVVDSIVQNLREKKASSVEIADVMTGTALWFERALAEERALADRLADAISKHKSELPSCPDYCDQTLWESLTAWKEARKS